MGISQPLSRWSTRESHIPRVRTGGALGTIPSAGGMVRAPHPHCPTDERPLSRTKSNSRRSPKYRRKRAKGRCSIFSALVLLSLQKTGAWMLRAPAALSGDTHGGESTVPPPGRASLQRHHQGTLRLRRVLYTLSFFLCLWRARDIRFLPNTTMAAQPCTRTWSQAPVWWIHASRLLEELGAASLPYGKQRIYLRLVHPTPSFRQCALKGVS